MKASDIPDEVFLAAIDETARLRGEMEDCEWTIGVNRWDLTAYLAGHPEHIGGNAPEYPDMPMEVVVAKAADLVERRLVDGCTCGCRGDFTREAARPV